MAQARSSLSLEELEDAPSADRSLLKYQKFLKRNLDDLSYVASSENRREKRKKNIPTNQTGESLRFLIVHRVECDTHTYHDLEPKMYEETPRLYRGDDKTASLRGSTEIMEDF
jgi:hypothetical protein